MDIHKFHKPGMGFLDGQTLIAMPGMSDERFSRTVIYLCGHSDEGAMGLVINKPAANVLFSDLLVQLNVIDRDQARRLSARARQVPVLNGGPVEPARGFVLHSLEGAVKPSTQPVGFGIGLTVTTDMLHQIAEGVGPGQALLALGYAGWGAGQLERELRQNAWLHGKVGSDVLFSADHDAKYDRALRHLGVDPAFLAQEGGHA